MRSITEMQQQLGRGAFVTTVFSGVVLTLLIVTACRRVGADAAGRAVAGLALLGAVVGVLSLTLLGGDPDADPQLFLDPLQGAWGWSGIAWRPVMDNVILFVPIGAFAAAMVPRRGVLTVWWSCVAFSVLIEAFQYLVPTGRVANTADVLANAVGALIGVLMAWILGVGGRPRPGGDLRSSDPG